MQLKVLAPAKINLSLDIVRKRPDGYHDVAMVMQAVSLYDTITVSDEVDANSESDFSVSCNVEGIPTDGRNIVCKAANVFFEYTKLDKKRLSINIEKQIPHEAGLAGGSTDAAAVILALNRMFDTRLSEEQMCEIGAKIGADVPFCIVGGTKLASGTGTTLSKVAPLTKCYILICKPEVSVSTAEAYAKSDSKPSKGFLVTDEVVKMLYKRNLRGVCECLYNEFEAVMELPEIQQIKKRMMKHKALGACMSGSGSAVFGIFLDEKKALKCKQALSEDYDKLFVCEPVKGGCEIV